MKKIGIEDIFKEIDIFKTIRESAEKTITTLESMNREVMTTAETLKKAVGGAKFDSSKSINELNKAQTESNKLMKEAISIETLKAKADQQVTKASQEIQRLEALKAKRLQESAKAQTQASKSDTESIKTKREQLKLTRELERAEAMKNKELAKSEALARKEASAYSQLVAKTRELKNASKELASQMIALELAGKKNSVEYSKLATKYGQVTQQAQLADAQLKKIDSSVGDNFRNVGNYTGALNTLRNGLAQLGLAFGLSQIVGKATQTLVKFDEESANISKTLGVTKEEARGLSMELTKIDTRTSVEALQQIAVIGGQLGIGKKDIVGFTESIDKLNVALGDEFTGGAEEITSVVGGLRNVFSDIKSKNVSDDLLKIGNALNVLGAEGSATSPVMSDFAGRIGGVGIPLGLTTGQVLGLSATLQELNVSAERGGTAIGGILKKMAEDTEGFSELAGMGASEFANLVNTDLMGAFTKVVEGTRQFNGNAVGLAQTLDGLKLDGAGASEVFLKLANNTDLLKQRTDSANESLKQTSSITDEFSKKNDTLQAKIEKLKKAFDVYVLGIDETGAVTGTFGATIDFLAGNLGTIVNILGKVVRTWLIYKATMKAIQAQQWIANGGFKELGATLLKNIPYTRAYRLEQIQLARSQQMAGTTATGAGQAMTGAGNAMKAIPFVLIISLLVELYNWWSNVASASAEARRQADLYKANKDKADTKGSEMVEREKKIVAEKLRVLDREIRTRKANGESESKLSKEKATREKQIYADSKKSYEQSITSLEANIKFTKSEKARIEKLKSESNQIRMGGQGGANFLSANLGETKQTLQQQELLLAKLKNGRKEFNDALDEAQLVELEALVNTEDYSVNINKTKESFKGAGDGAKDFAQDFKTALEDVNDYIQESINLMQQLEEIFQNRVIQNLTKEIDALIEKAKAQAESTNVVMGVTLKQAKTPDEQDAVDKANLEALNTANTELNAKISERYALEQKNLQQRKNFAVNQLVLNNEIAKEAELNKLISNKIELLAQEGLKKADKAKIEKDFEEKVKQLEIENFQRDEDLRLNTLLLDEKLTDDQIKLEEEKVKAKTDANQKILDDNKKFNKENSDDKAKNDADEIKKEAEKQKTIQEIIKASSEYFVKQSEKKIAQIDKELASAEKTQTLLEDLAKNGNITAQQSLAENQKIIDEANKKKEKEQKRIQRIKLAETALTTYSQKVESGSKTALADTIKDIALLQTFIATIPAFEDGTEDTGKNGHGVDGKGGFHAILHPNERVVPKHLNRQIGAMSNEQLAQLATESKNANLMKSDFQSASALDTLLLANKIDLLTETIRNKPETNIELGEITQSMMEIVKTTKTGNTKIFNRYKIRP